jgi:chromatin segregation and condensation protein Rec8/ScpA/Scc1 (kleisin family)
VPDIPDLMFRVRRTPNRKITLEELMSALDDVIRVEHKREEYFKRTETQQQFVVEIDDMDDKVDRIYDMIMASSNGNITIIFDELSKNVDRNSILSDLFVPLLFLEQNGRISLRQDVFFGDIYISVK